MDWLQLAFLTIRDFSERGGFVLSLIIGVILIMWTLILSRWLYLRFDYHADIEEFLARWSRWSGSETAFAAQVGADSRNAIEWRLRAGINTIRTISGICPLLGLLGTVTGMIMIFDTMAIAKLSSPRIVAAGVSTAMVTTMAGMVGALSGIFPAVLLSRLARRTLGRLRRTRHGGRLQQAQPAASAAHGSGRTARILRQALAPVGAVLITLSLVFAMEQMIRVGRAVINDPSPGIPVDFVRIERPRFVEQRTRKPDRPSDPQEQPSIPEAAEHSDTASSASALAIAAPRAEVAFSDLRTTPQRGFAGVQDGEYLPIVKVAPIYPRRAELRRLEGWVIVRFTVTATGTVRDIEVVEASDPVFIDAAVEAAAKFRYRPRVVNGEAIEVHGVPNRITFILQQ